MKPRERPGKRGLVFPPSCQGERYTEAEELAHERLQEAEGERAPADCDTCHGDGCVDVVIGQFDTVEDCPMCHGSGTA